MNLYDGETIKTMILNNMRLTKLIKKNPHIFLTSRFFSIPLPGTQFYKECRNSGIILTHDYSYHYGKFIVYVPHSFLNSRCQNIYFSKFLNKTFFLNKNKINFKNEKLKSRLSKEECSHLVNSILSEFRNNKSVKEVVFVIEEIVNTSYYDALELLIHILIVGLDSNQIKIK